MGNIVDLNNQPVEPDDGKQVAVAVENLTKIYKLYDRNRDRMREALGLTGKKLHREHFALNGVDIKIYQGETVGIIGTNGSGKSTLLKIITGVLNPTGGSVTVNGRISALLELGAGFNMEYSGIENIYLNGTMMGFSKAEIKERMQAILEFADIGNFVNQPVKTYSSGMFVRLAFAVAINIDPEILIVDEALSVGDVFFQSKCYHKFEEFKKMGKTILFVSHDLSSIAKYCDRVILLDRGKKLGEGTARQMIDDYKRVLVGQYEMNEQRAEETVSAGENPELLEYGTKQAEITEFYITDHQGKRGTAVIKGTEFKIHMCAEFYEDISAPIFAFAFKNIKGTEITGTNTMFEKSLLEPVKAGAKIEVVFTQKMSLQGGEYLLSLGLTGYEKDDFQVYHRLYDVLNVTVISDKDTVGFYDMESTVTVIGAGETKTGTDNGKKQR